MQTANIPSLLDNAILITHIIFIFSHLKYLHAWPDDKIVIISFDYSICEDNLPN